jgi:hypothetical protein
MLIGLVNMSVTTHNEKLGPLLAMSYLQVNVARYSQRGWYAVFNKLGCSAGSTFAARKC